MGRHDELRKTWAPGQLWETLVDGCDIWVPVRDGGRAEPAWDEFQAYRQRVTDTKGEAEEYGNGTPMERLGRLLSMAFDASHPALKDWALVSAAFKRQRALLERCLPVVQQDATMMADISRHSPLPEEAQALHDGTEYDSERLVREIPAELAGEAPEPVYWQWRRVCDAWSTAMLFPTEPAVTAPGTQARPLYAGPVVDYKEGQA